MYIYLSYIDTDEIPGFFHLLKNHLFTARSENTYMLFAGLGLSVLGKSVSEVLSTARGRAYLFLWEITL